MERTPIHDLVEASRAGLYPYLIKKMPSGWLVAADQPLVQGHCVLLADPIVFGLNDLDEKSRLVYLSDCCRVGDALLKVNGSYRINYETLCNVAQALHSHIIPRYLSEPKEKRQDRAAVAYPRAKKVSVSEIKSFIEKMKQALD